MRSQVNASGKGQAHRRCRTAKQLTRCTDCGSGSCIDVNGEDEFFICTASISSRSYDLCQPVQLRVEQLGSPPRHVAHAASRTTPRPLPPKPPRTESAFPTVEVPTAKESFVTETCVPEQSAHHADSLEKSKADAEDIIGMLEALTRSCQHADPFSIGSFSQTAPFTDFFSVRRSVSLTADSFSQAPDRAYGCPSQQPVLSHQHSFSQPMHVPYNSASPNPARDKRILQQLPLHAHSSIEQAACSHLSFDPEQHFPSPPESSEADRFFQQRQDLLSSPAHAYHPQQCASIASFGQEEPRSISEESSYRIRESSSEGSLNLQMQEFHGSSFLLQHGGCIPFTKQIMHAQPVVMPPLPKKKKSKKASFRYKKDISILRTG
mmetsp:Transcript_49269/g.122411  ORF Transcript_49269/g.122411 Transcript_49269/m.122411 type:complete len:378 (-) Transcript_49269:248-1381(-)